MKQTTAARKGEEEGPWLPTAQLLAIALEVFRDRLKVRKAGGMHLEEKCSAQP